MTVATPFATRAQPRLDESAVIDVPTSLARGLTSVEASARLARDGPNALPRARRAPLSVQLARQLVHFFALMLWAASLGAFVAGMPELGIGIAIVVVVNALFAFAQEYRADRAADRVRDLMPRRATVRRDGELVEVDATTLVRGDVVALRPGDRVSADIRVAEAHDLELDMSTLTGESVPVALSPAELAPAGTFVARGAGVGSVIAIGAGTRLAEIAELTRAGRRPPSPLARELDRLVRTIALLAIAVGALFFAINLLVRASLSGGLLFAIGVTVALVPEGLLPTLTLALAMGAQRMAAKHALVRRLESVETLGSTTFICTDKTGTLTENRMMAVALFTPQGGAEVSGEGYDPTIGGVEADAALMPRLRELARAAARCSEGRAVLRDGAWVAQGDPMEAALDVLARRVGVDLERDLLEAPIGRQFPFHAERRRMSLVAGNKLLVKGAPDAILPLSNNRRGAEQALVNMADRGLRVIAVASRAASELPTTATAESAEQRLELIGLIGLEDPPRADVAEAIRSCRRAGIRVAMVTGDHPSTAKAIAKQVGLLGRDALVIEGRDLPEDEAMLGALVDRDGMVVSRVTPEDKLRIARALRARGHVVAMTGDGVNDGPALREADIGIAMGLSGTDVAREASDLVLLDDRFSTIVTAVEQGRATFSNIRRFLTYHLTDNVAELAPFVVWALSGGRFPLAIGVLQILALDIGTDLLPALALGAEPPARHVLEQPPTRRHLVEPHVLVRALGVLGPVEALVALSAFVVALGNVWHPGQAFPTDASFARASGAAFAAIVIGQMANALACRSASRPIWSLRFFANPLLLGAIIVELVALVGFLFIGPVARRLGHAPPPFEALWVVVLAAPAVLLVDSIYKLLERKRWHRLSSNRGRLRPVI